MDPNWVQHVTAILDYVDARTANPTGQVLQSARDLMASLDAWSFLGSTSNYDIQIRALDVLQCLAYNDVDRGAIADIGNWALERWLRVLQRHPRSVSALKGVGNWWLLRAQPCLARIHAVEGSSSGSEGSRHRNSSEAGPQSDQDTRRAEQAQREAEARLGTADYVEARGILQPATEYLHRAVQEATAQDSLTAQLLIMAAEAYMSLGNVSSTRDGERLFRQAVLYLRQASDIPGYPLPAHLQRWLDEYGHFVD